MTGISYCRHRTGSLSLNKNRVGPVQAYKHGFLTLGTLAKKLHKNPVEAFEQLRNTVDIGIRSATGDPQEFVEARALLKGGSCQLVADITSLLTWYDLGIADEIVQVFGRVAVVQSTIDSLLYMLLTRKSARKNASLFRKICV
jgi:hypothetical protein